MRVARSQSGFVFVQAAFLHPRSEREGRVTGGVKKVSAMRGAAVDAGQKQVVVVCPRSMRTALLLHHLARLFGLP